MTRSSDSSEAGAMPDFHELLARELRREAAQPVAALATRRSFAWRSRRWVRPAAALGVPAAVAAAAVILFLAPDRAVVAHAGPPVLQAPEVDPTQFGQSVLAQAAFGPDVQPEVAHEFSTEAGSAYLIGYDGGWCVSVPDPALPNGAQERGVSCVRKADFERFGIAVTIGRQYVAALPAGVPPPLLRTPGGERRTIAPSADYATVALQASVGSSIVRYSKDGATRVDRIR